MLYEVPFIIAKRGYRGAGRRKTRCMLTEEERSQINFGISICSENTRGWRKGEIISF